MTRDQDLERHLSDWLAEGPVRAPDEVVDEALERAAGRRQHHPLRIRLAAVIDALTRAGEGGVRPLPAAAVVVVLVGAVLLMASMLTLDPLGRGPGDAPPMDATAVRAVEGTIESISVTDTAGGSERTLRLVTEDPRIRGEARQVLTMEDSPESGLTRSTGIMRLENDWGAWEGTIDGVRYPDGTEIEYGWLAGKDAYAGYSYFHSTRDHPAEAERALEGAIWPGEPPPMPDPSLLQADPLG